MASHPALPSLASELDPQLLLDQALDLIPLAAAIVSQENGCLNFVAVNRVYRLAALGVVAERSPLLADLGDQIEAFLASSSVRYEFPWELGDRIDRRHYDVTLSRLGPQRPRCLVTLIDRTTQHYSERSLRREMKTDSLTGLPNREGFGDLIEAAADARDHHAVLVVDLVRFGRLNACLGSLSGDEMLITVARRIKGALRTRDTLARIGGDEFGILMTIDRDGDEADQVAQRIRDSLAMPFRLSDYEIRIDCSIGIAHGDETVDSEELIRHAQFATKRAKTSGRPESYQTQAFAIARAQFGIETALRRAIESRALRLVYQPICDLSSGQIVAFEALARWRTEDGVEMLPAQFIPVAEESGLIVPLGRWAINEAMRTLAGWDVAAGGSCGIQIGVNVSPIQLHRDDVVEAVQEALAESGMNGSRLKLELTESALVTEPDRIANTMRALKDLGVSLAMDDFGTGYSNLAFLQKLPIDILKIDRSFVTGMLADRDKIAIVRAVLSLAQALNLKTIAEGIETEALAQTLTALGCHFGQGFLYARPLEAADAFALIASRNA